MTFYQLKDKESGHFVEWDNEKKQWFYSVLYEAPSDAGSPIENMNEAFENGTIEYFIVPNENVVPCSTVNYYFTAGWSDIKDIE